jgi:hypothetical protein
VSWRILVGINANVITAIITKQIREKEKTKLIFPARFHSA